MRPPGASRTPVTTVLLAVMAAALLAGCSVAGPSGTAPSGSPVPSLTVAVSPAGSVSPTGSVSPSGPLGQAELRLRLISTFGSLWYCDPDQYPIARGDVTQIAVERFPEVRADPSWAAIAGSLGLDPGAASFTPEQQLAAYDLWKELAAIRFVPVAGGWSFDQVFGPKDAGGATGERVTGTIAPDGTISIAGRVPSGMPNCPICLVRGTRIATPAGSVPVESIRVGMTVLTLGPDGRPAAAPVLQVGSTPVPASHLVVHLVLADGRSVTASPGHPLPDGRPIGELAAGDVVQGVRVAAVTLEPYAGGATFDLLPAGPTGAYLADGIWLGSTLAHRGAAPTAPLATTGR